MFAPGLSLTHECVACLSAGHKCPNSCPLAGGDGPRWCQRRKRRARHDGQCVAGPLHGARSEDADNNNTTERTRTTAWYLGHFIFSLLRSTPLSLFSNSGGWSQGVRSLRDESALWWVFMRRALLIYYKKGRKKWKVVRGLNWGWQNRARVTASAEVFQKRDSKKAVFFFLFETGL